MLGSVGRTNKKCFEVKKDDEKICAYDVLHNYVFCVFVNDIFCSCD